MQRKLWKTIKASNASKNAALPQVFFSHILRTVLKDFQSFSKFFQSISTIHSVSFKFMSASNRCTKWKMYIFNSKARGNTADTANGCQMMSYYHVKKDLNRNECLNLNLE